MILKIKGFILVLLQPQNFHNNNKKCLFLSSTFLMGYINRIQAIFRIIRVKFSGKYNLYLCRFRTYIYDV
jgi:hypothetical protein